LECRRETVLTERCPGREGKERSEADMEGHGVVWRQNDRDFHV
jgi:hypothetical protein